MKNYYKKKSERIEKEKTTTIEIPGCVDTSGCMALIFVVIVFLIMIL